MKYHPAILIKKGKRFTSHFYVDRDGNVLKHGEPYTPSVVKVKGKTYKVLSQMYKGIEYQRLLHLVVYDIFKGSTDGYVMFKNNDTLDCSLNNLYVISRSDRSIMRVKEMKKNGTFKKPVGNLEFQVNFLKSNKDKLRKLAVEACYRKYGKFNATAKLTDEDVLSIRQNYKGEKDKWNLHLIGKKYGVKWFTIDNVLRGRTFKHLL